MFRIYLIFITIINISSVIDTTTDIHALISIMRITMENIFADNLINFNKQFVRVFQNILLYSYDMWHFNYFNNNVLIIN